MNNKERIFYLDFIRAVATLVIILTHYNATFLYLANPMPQKVILTLNAFNIYIGAWGVSLFFIISGAALTYVYQEGFSNKTYYKKRIIGIYPMLWLAFVLALSYYVLRYKTYNPWGVNSGDGWKILLSFIGIDQYVASFTATFSMVGEWFLGCLILLYAIFPLMRKVVKNPARCILFMPIIVLLYIFGLKNHMTPLPISSRVLVRLPEFMFGMVFMEYRKSINKQLLIAAGAISILILAFNQIFSPQIDSNVQTTYIGITSFIALICIANTLKRYKCVNYLTQKVCKYSYAIYLTHHFIIREVVKVIDFENISMSMNYVVFFVTCELIVLISILLYKLNKKINQEFNILRGSVEEETSYEKSSINQQKISFHIDGKKGNFNSVP